VAGESGWRYPPAGVPTEAEPSRGYLPLSEAAQRAGIDRRTLQSAVVRGDTGGWARPGPGHLRWFVYEDSLPSARGDDVAGRLDRLEVENQRLSARLVDLQMSRVDGGGSDSAETVVADLRARLVMAEEANLLLISAHEDLAAAADKYRRALAQFMTPGHVGELTEGSRRAAERRGQGPGT
jgi:hypothetical protein